MVAHSGSWWLIARFSTAHCNTILRHSSRHCWSLRCLLTALQENCSQIWLLVFFCSTTTCINVRILEDYSTPSFIQAFMRSSCQFGYQSKLLIDEGGQLVKGCQTMKFDLIISNNNCTEMLVWNFKHVLLGDTMCTDVSNEKLSLFGIHSTRTCIFTVYHTFNARQWLH